MAGLVGLYARQSEAVGVLGLVGFAAALFGTGMVLGFFWDNAFAVPALARTTPTVLEAGSPDLVNFGVTFRAGVYPPAAAVILADPIRAGGVACTYNTRRTLRTLLKGVKALIH